MKFAFIALVLIVGLSLIASSGLALFSPETAAAIQPAGTRVAASQARVTERPTAPPTISAAQITIEAGQARMVELAVESTALALEITDSAAQLSERMTQTSAAHAWTATAQADAGTVQAHDATSQAGWTRSTATGAAMGTQAVIASTQVAATLVKLSEDVQTARAAGASAREFIPWQNAWGLGWPIAATMIIAGGAILIIWRGVALVERAAELRMLPHYEPSLPDVEEYDDEPDEPIEAPRIDVKVGNQVQRVNLPCTAEQLRHLAAGVVDGMGLTDREWIDNGFTALDWPPMREELIKRGWAMWRSSATKERGARWTSYGLQAMQQIALSPLQQAPLP